MIAKVILNPYAGRWKAHRHIEEIKQELRIASMDYIFSVTDSPKHGIDLAYQSVKDGFSPIISAGGDGSINEVVNGMMAAWQENPDFTLPPLGIIPLGSVNDLVNNLKLPNKISEAVRVIKQGKSKKYDLGKVNDRFFDNNSAVGLEPAITLIQQKFKHLQGPFRYLVATLIGISKNQHWEMDLEWEGGSYSGNITLVTVGINPLTGGLFYMTPGADPRDGLLTFTFGYLTSRMRILSVLPKTMKPGRGNYIENPNIFQNHTKWLCIKSKQQTALHADGEIITEQINKIEYKVVPRCLSILG
jgi:YegS/Rv2252/BmrU family lipid kinase